MRIDSSGNVGIGTTDTLLFNATGGSTRLAACGSSALTNIAGNTSASISIINTDTTANNTAGLHFARADTDDTPNYAGASIVAQFPDTQVASQYPKGLLAFLTSTTANAAPSEKMRIDSSGNVGIGTASPSSPLNVVSASSSLAIAINGRSSDNLGAMYFYANNGTTNYATITASATEFRQSAVPAASVQTFYTNASERMRIDASGNLLVGTTSTFNSGLVNISYNSASNVGITLKQTNANNSGTFLNFAQSATSIGSITGNATNIAYNTSSDYRLKNTVAPMTGALDKVALLKPVTYKWNVDGSDGQGFIAHELAEVEPNCVTGEKDATREEEYEVSPAVPAAVDADGKETTPAVEAVKGTRTVPSYQGVDTSFLVATLTAAIQEQQALILALTDRIAALENK
jgi:hypothetical protein